MYRYTFAHSTFIFEILRLVGGMPGSPSVATYVVLCYPSLLWQAFMMLSVTKAMPIQFIHGKCNTYKKWKGCKIALSSYYT